eukprot:5629393-Pleurochrysis_carterae.AAC.3
MTPAPESRPRSRPCVRTAAAARAPRLTWTSASTRASSPPFSRRRSRRCGASHARMTNVKSPNGCPRT